MACGCGKSNKTKGCTGPNCGGADSAPPIVEQGNTFEIEGYSVPIEEPVVLANAKESLLLSLNGADYIWKAGQSRILPETYANQLIAQGAPIWIIS